MTATISGSLSGRRWQSVQPSTEKIYKCTEDRRGRHTWRTDDKVMEFVQGRAVSPTVHTWVLHVSCARFSLFKIIFYESRNFQGRHWECSTDCMNTFRHINFCNSIRVSGGQWVAYEKPYFMGYQYILGPGEYPDYQTWMGFNNCIRSCQLFSPVSQSNRQPPPLQKKPQFSPCTSNAALEIGVNHSPFDVIYRYSGRSLHKSLCCKTHKETQSAFKRNTIHPS